MFASEPTFAQVFFALSGAALFAGVFLWLIWLHEPLFELAHERNVLVAKGDYLGSHALQQWADQCLDTVGLDRLLSIRLSARTAARICVESVR